MRKELFSAIAARLSEQAPSVAYVDLWNADLDELEGGAVWALPAVFVEFEAIEWEQTGLSLRQGDAGVRLHVVTRAVEHSGSQDARMEAALERFGVIEEVQRALWGLSGTGFTTLTLTTSATNHQHAELVEDIERYVTRLQEADHRIRKTEARIVAHINPERET